MNALTPATAPAWLARTKLRPPAPRADTIPRRRLLDALVAGVRTRRATVIVAPAGYGKSTLLAALPAALPDLPLAWLALDADDDDPARFLAALIAAVRQIDPACGGAAAALLAELPDPGAEAHRVVDLLINEIIATPEPFALVLDDLHAVTQPPIFAALDRLIERAPPQMRLVIAARHDPPLALARLRARRDLAELRADDLRFTLIETEQLLRDTLGLDLPAERAATLHGRVDGWAAGTILLADAHAPTPDTGASDGSPLSPDDERHVFDYLAEEVLHAQPPATRDFLVRTAVLTDLTPALCHAVTGRADAATILAALYRRNLFVAAIAGGFRYHDLFRDFLLGQLAREGDELARECHRRAAAAEANPVRAVRHWLAAAAWDEAATAIEGLGNALIDQGDLATLADWIAALPAATRDARPRLRAFLGIIAHERADLTTARALLERAVTDLAATGDGAARGTALLYLATCRSTMADLAGAAAAAEEALRLPIPPHRRIHLLVGMAWQLLGSGDVAATNAALDEALALAATPGGEPGLRPFATQFHAPFAVLPGGGGRAERCAHLLDVASEAAPGPWRAGAASLHGLATLYRGRWDEAIAAFERALTLGEPFGGPLWVTVGAAPHLAAALALRGDSAAAEARFDALFRTLADPAARTFAGPWLPVYRCLRARVAWLAGRTEEVRRLGAEIVALPTASDWPVAMVVRAVLDAVVALAEGRMGDAEATLRATVARQQQVPGATICGEPAVLLAHLLRLTDRPREAVATLAPILADQEREGTPGRLLLEGGAIIGPLLRLAVGAGVHPAFATRTLTLLETNRLSTAAIPAPASAAEASALLSQRELEVLRLIAAGAGNAAIADTLFLSPHTVKRHVANLLRKLDVDSRAQAVMRATERGFL